MLQLSVLTIRDNVRFQYARAKEFQCHLCMSAGRKLAVCNANAIVSFALLEQQNNTETVRMIILIYYEKALHTNR